MLISYTKNKFPAEYVPTVFDNYIVDIAIDDSDVPDINEVKMDLWDTAGQEDYDKLRPLSYDETDIFVMCFSTTERSSFDNIKERWFPEIEKKMPKRAGKTCAMVVGTKIDLRESAGPDKVSKAEGMELAEELGITYMECSALTQDGLTEIFDKLVNIYLDQFKAQGATGGRKPSVKTVKGGLDGANTGLCSSCAIM